MPVCAWVDGEYGLSGAYLGVEAELGKEGVRKVIETPLTESEKAHLVEAYEAVLAKQADVKDLGGNPCPRSRWKTPSSSSTATR